MPGLGLTGIEYYPEALPIAGRRLSRAQLVQGDICNLASCGEFDVVGCFDVLEHIDDDQLALNNLARCVRPGGGLILTVPQYPKLWSISDEVGYHRRRYLRRELEEKIRRSGLECLRVTSFVAFLLPLVWLRRRSAHGMEDALGELTPSPISNAIGRALMRLERMLIARGLSFPMGASLFIVATKPSN